MNSHALLGVSALMSFVASSVAADFYVWPRLRVMNRMDALVPLVTPHMFLRTIGPSFLVPGVVSPSLPTAFAIVLVWVFNVWGAADLLNAIYEGNVRAKIDPGALGAAFFIPTFIVPPLLVTHGLIFWLLLRSKAS